MRLVALDIGAKRTGIAVTDELQIIASGLTTVDSAILFDFLKKYFAENNVEKVVIGMPKNLQNKTTDGTGIVVAFLQKFKIQFPEMPYQTVDERFTSKMAFQTMIDSGLGKKDRRNKALVDEISATIILQGYLESLG
jgi:putative holliday junction resolvase